MAILTGKCIALSVHKTLQIVREHMLISNVAPKDLREIRTISIRKGIWEEMIKIGAKLIKQKQTDKNNTKNQ